MKKKSIFFAILGSLLGLGIILTIVGFLLGGKVHSLSIGFDRNSTTLSKELQNMTMTGQDIQNLNFDLAASSIKIRRGDTFSIQANRLSENKIKNGIWTVESNLSDHFNTINFFGLVKIPIP